MLACAADGSVLPLEGRLLDGKFRLDQKIGDGGMASVWQATNVRVERTVAIKLMHTRYADDAELLARFRNEAAAAGKIGSPHICDVLDFGESPIGLYIVMELLDGCSLADLIQQHRRLDPGLAVWIARQALAGLAAAHRAGVIHRDLKPENIHLCRAIRGQWIIKLMDFGISKFTQDPNTRAGATLGTPHYMAPEQVQGASKVDARADLWSMGVILYEAITGVQLFARENVGASLAALRTFDPPPLTQHRPDAPRGLAEVIARCLVRAPERRIASADALAEALAPFEQPGPRAREAVAAAGASGATAKLASREVAAALAAQRAAQAQAQAQAQPGAQRPAVQAAPRVAVQAAPQPVAQPVPADRVDPAASVRSPRLPVPSSQRTGAQVSLPRGPTGPVAPMPQRGAAAPAARPVPDGIKPTAAPAGPAAARSTGAQPQVAGASAQAAKPTGARAPVVPARPIARAAATSPIQPGKPGVSAIASAKRAAASAGPASQAPAKRPGPAPAPTRGAPPPATAEPRAASPQTPQRAGRPALWSRIPLSNEQMLVWGLLIVVILGSFAVIIVLATR
ncbi:MAG: protein kinase [Myxococcales bacterium]|nr:protein kinase [Myxococcales bacterium]